MRLKSAIWVSGYLRQCQVEGAFAVVRRHGADDAGAIFVKIDRLDGTADLYGPAPQTAFDEGEPGDRLFISCLTATPASEAEVEARLNREVRFDPDLWIVVVEDRQGRHFLGQLAR